LFDCRSGLCRDGACVDLDSASCEGEFSCGTNGDCGDDGLCHERPLANEGLCGFGGMASTALE
jgi:hypothetical protein